MKVLNWLTRNTYSRFDALWIALSVLAWRDHRYVASLCFVVVGAVVSGALGAAAKHWAEVER